MRVQDVFTAIGQIAAAGERFELVLADHFYGWAFQPPLGPPGFKRLLTRARKPYRTLDGHACILPYSDRNWQDFYAFTGRTAG